MAQKSKLGENIFYFLLIGLVFIFVVFLIVGKNTNLPNEVIIGNSIATLLLVSIFFPFLLSRREREKAGIYSDPGKYSTPSAIDDWKKVQEERRKRQGRLFYSSDPDYTSIKWETNASKKKRRRRMVR